MQTREGAPPRLVSINNGTPYAWIPARAAASCSPNDDKASSVVAPCKGENAGHHAACQLTPARHTPGSSRSVSQQVHQELPSAAAYVLRMGARALASQRFGSPSYVDRKLQRLSKWSDRFAETHATTIRRGLPLFPTLGPDRSIIRVLSAFLSISWLGG
ncbi:hypothetical protein C8J57DRAFT_1240070 [Mycena rebaudengoi]|nr:hypothetical protein C8J57DRAFT_1240070 [Mycena rebaudengoi]